MNKSIINKSDNERVYQYKFNNMVELVDYVNSAPINTRIFTSGLSSKRTNDYSWYKTRNFEEAIEYCLHGDMSAIELFNSSNQQASLLFPKLTQKRNIVDDYYGHRVNVSRYLTSNPRCMYRLDRNEKFNVLEIYYNVSAIASCNGNQLFNRGVATINLIKLLENLGYRVKLNFVSLSEEKSIWTNEREIFYFSINLKRTDEKISPAICCFPMCNPSFFRRIIFRLRETTDFKIYDWGDGYGSTLSPVDTKIFFEEFENKDMSKCIIIGDPGKMGIRGENLEDDIVKLFEVIDINKYIDGVEVLYDEVNRGFTLKRKR